MAGRLVRLTVTEDELLRVLSLNAGRISTYDRLQRQVWGDRATNDTEAMTRHGQTAWPVSAAGTLADRGRYSVYYAPMKARVPAAFVGLIAVTTALLMGCAETMPVPDIVSRTFTVASGDFLRTRPSGQNAVAIATYDMPEITENTVEAGTVAAETDLGSLGATWSALPITLRFEDLNGVAYVVELQTAYREGKFVVVLQSNRLHTVAAVLAVDGYRIRATVVSADDVGD